MKLSLQWLLCFFVSVSFLSESYGQRYFVKSYSVTEGLSEALVYDICEDPYGNIWIATQGGGINKFDGHSFTSYKTCNGLPNNYITRLLWSRNNLLWMATWDGVVIFDGKVFKKAFPSVFQGKFMVCILEDKLGNIWMQPETGGVYKYDGKKLTHYGNESGFSDEFIDYMWLDPDTDEVYFCVSQEKRIYVQRNGKFTLFHPEGMPDSLEVSSICRQGKRFWFGTYQGIASLENGVYSEHWRSQKAAVSAIASIEMDKTGHVWFASIHGTVRFDGNDFEELTENQGFTNAPVRRIFVDSKNTVWFATFADGIKSFFYSPFQSLSKVDGLKSYGVMSINQDSSGNLWFGQAGEGMIRFQSNKKMVYPLGWKFPNSLIRCSLTDSYGDVWCGTTFGLFRYHKDRIIQVGIDEGFEHESIRCGMVASNGDLWWGCKEGLIKIFERKSKKFTTISLNIERGVFGVIYSFLEIEPNKVLVGTSVGLFLVENGKASRLTLNGYSNDRINCLVKGKGDYVWMGMLDRGVAVYNLKTKEIKSFGQVDALFSHIVYALVFDNQENLWIGTEDGLFRMAFGKDYNVNHVHQFGKNEGFEGVEVNHNALIKLKSGIIWAGTVKGAFCFDPERVLFPSFPPKVHLTGVKLFYKRTDWSQRTLDLDRWNNVPNQLELNYLENNIRFDFNAVDLRFPQKNWYSYTLEGLDENWTPWDDVRNAQYAGLRPGEYTFKVKAMNEDGQGKEVVLAYPMVIYPPFWQTWWFYMLEVLVVVFAIIGVVRYRWEQREKKLRLYQQIKQEESHRVRKMAAQDFHDELGNHLAGISVLSQVIGQKLENQQYDGTVPLIRQVENYSKQLFQGTRDFIWSLDPKNDNLYELAVYLKDFSADLFQYLPVNVCVLGLDERLKKCPVPPSVSRQLVLIFKEAITNTLKHAGATELVLQFEWIAGQDFSIVMNDNGIGFDKESVCDSNGLANMKHRVAKISGHFNVESSIGFGTTIIYSTIVQMDKEVSPSIENVV